jgi:sugar O-acyltransferase (sialic acid O-acetyltransferase NeuD family)
MKIFVYGAGGHGKVVADILLSKGEDEFAGFVDDREELWGTEVMGLPVLGGSEWLGRQCGNSRVAVAMGVGENRTRQALAEECVEREIEIVTLIHPAATTSRTAQLGAGAVVMAGAILNVGAKVGAGAIVNTAAVVEHDVEVGDYAHVAPNGTMAGASRLGAFSHLGAGAIVLQGVQVGCNTIVGAGAVVTKNLPDEVVAIGVPARIYRHIEKSELFVKRTVFAK